MPLGAIVAYVGGSAPAGWLLCDGRPIPSEYKKLADLLGQSITPDLRGLFLRGFDGSGKIDPGTDDAHRKFLSIQGDTVGPHTHTYSRAFHMAAGKSGANPPDLPADQAATPTSPPVEGGGRETRPKNFAVNYIIQAVELEKDA